MTVRWNARAAVVKSDPAVSTHLFDIGAAIAVQAALYAPKRTGAGAQSIRAELAGTPEDPEVRVSWDRDHFYMAFAEFGTEHQAAESFLRRAADAYK